MKKVFFFSAIAAAALTGCSSDEFVGGQPQVEPTGEEMAIAFGGKSNLITRATATGGDAAAKLNNAFVVYGTKHVSAAEDKTATNDEVVYNQYQVAYTANTAGTTESNTHNWEYVGKNAYSSLAQQTIKYWDLSAANGYTFYAFSSSNISYPADPADLVSVTKTTAAAGATDTKYDKGYTVTIKNGASVDNLYYADRVEVAKAKYGDPVVFTFRNMGSRVRVGFYEQVPGYSVKIDKFYFDEDAAAPVTTYAAMTDESTTNFVAAMQNVKVGATSNALNVTYYDDSDPSIENQVKVTNTTVTYDYTLKLGDQITAATAIGTSPATATWDKSAGAYTTVYPFEANTNPMIVRVDYTLVGDDGQGEEIHVKNARVMVPLQHCQWKSNYAYTYLFKITDLTNGTTGNVPTNPDDPTTGDEEGLFPITFDAVVINATDGIQETISTLSTNSVTTYVEGKVSSDYQNGEDIYAVVTDPVNKTNVAPSAIGAANGNAQVYLIGGTNATKATEADVYAKLTGINNNITLTAVTPAATLQQYVPATDGTNYDFGAKGSVKFTPAAAGKYAYVYTTTAYVAPTYAAVDGADDFDPAVTYYFKTTGDVYYAASGLSAENWATYKSQLYTKTAAGTAGDYTIKVITVQ